MTANDNRHIASIDSSRLLEDDDKSVLSDAQSIDTGDRFQQDVDEALSHQQSEQAVDASDKREDSQPEIIPQQAAWILARPRRIPRRANAANTLSGDGRSFLVSPQPAPREPLPHCSSFDPSPQSSFQEPESLDPESTSELPKDKGKEVLFDVPAHERPSTDEKEGELGNLDFARVLPLLERFQLEISAESRPIHTDEYYGEMQEEMQANFDPKLAAEKAEREDEKGGAKARKDRSANQVIALIESIKKILELYLRASFLKGEEKGDESAVAELQARCKGTDEHPANKEKQQDLTCQKASNETLQQYFAIYQTRKETQPPAEDCATRLQDLQARLEQKHSRELEEQTARSLSDFTMYVELYKADRDAELAQATAKAAEEELRSQKAIASLEKEIELYQAALEWEAKSSREAMYRIQSLQDRERELGKEKKRESNTNKQLEAALSQMAKDCKDLSVRVKALQHSLKRTERTMEGVQEEVMEVAEARRAAEAEVRSLRAANLALRAEKEELEARYSSTFKELNVAFLELDRCEMQSDLLTAELRRVGGRLAEVNAAFVELDRCQTQSKHLTAELRRVGGRLAECEATIKKEADKARELEDFVDGRLKVWEKWEKWEQVVWGAATAPPEPAVAWETEKEEKEMSVLFEVHRWSLKELVLWLVVAFWAALASDQMWLGDDVGVRPILSRQDPFLDLSRGMYGV
ncbi:hypothetical protein MMC29_006372 [Sticta canariensis]|nr:hypothetical protein [Sticta canariensis]